MAKKNELSPLELHALKILGKKADDCRDELQAGTGQAIHLVLRITGAIDVGTPGNFTGDIKPALADVLAITLSTLGPRGREQLAQDLATAYSKAPPGETPAVHTDHRLAADKLIRSITRTEEKSRRGAVSGSLKIERLPAGRR